MARGLPLVGASTLEILATEYGLEEATMNAGRGRVYVWRRTRPDDVDLREGSAPDRVRHAGGLAEIGWQRLRAGETLQPGKLEPIYVQPPHVTVSHKKAHMQAA